MPVVILIDEYDKPLIDHLGKGKESLGIAKENRDILKYFFGVIKGGDVASALRFVFWKPFLPAILNGLRKNVIDLQTRLWKI